MKEIILYGELARRFGKYHRFAVKNTAEAIRALKANCKGFERYMCNAHSDNVGFRIFVGRSAVNDYKEIHSPAGQAVIRIVPVIIGSKSPWVKILIGVALIAAAVVITVGSAGAGTPLSAQILGMTGASLFIGGVAQLLSPPPKTPGSPESNNKNSSIFNGPANVTAQGAAVPVGYGRLVVGSVIISAGIETYEEQ